MCPPAAGHPQSAVAAPGIRLFAPENADIQSHTRIPADDIYSCGFVNAELGADGEPQPKDRGALMAGYRLPLRTADFAD